MKRILKAILTMVCMAWIAIACKTTSHCAVERKTQNVERQWEAKADTVSEHTADSVLVYVERGDSLVRIVERTVHTREKVKVVRDTVVIYARNDSIVKEDVVKEKAPRGPPRWKLYLVILGLVSIVILCVAVKSKIIKTLLKI